MMNTYTTVQGDTWDSITFKLYGDPNYMGYLIESNWPTLDYLVFPDGIVLNVPEPEDIADERLPFWRKA